MSTIAKLDPRVRQRRAERRGLRIYYERKADLRTEEGRKAAAVARALGRLRKIPFLSGDVKEKMQPTVIAAALLSTNPAKYRLAMKIDESAPVVD